MFDNPLQIIAITMTLIAGYLSISVFFGKK